MGDKRIRKILRRKSNWTADNTRASASELVHFYFHIVYGAYFNCINAPKAQRHNCDCRGFPHSVDLLTNNIADSK